MLLGFTTAFGGGLIRNILIGIPIENFWLQGYLFEIAFLAITIVYILPREMGLDIGKIPWMLMQLV